jgi:uncharacterized YccA/Bax inhibitor family protein
MLRSGNPALKDDTFNVPSLTSEETMTIQGTVWKTWALLLLVFASGYWSWNQPGRITAWLMPLCLISFGVALVTIFKKQWAPVLAPIYAFLEGLLLGVISVMFEKNYPGIVMQAVVLTFTTLGALLLAYQSRLIKVTENFKLGLFAATGAVALTYLINFGMSFFGKSIPIIHEASTAGIIFSAVVVVIAAFNLVLDFDFIEKGAESGAPKYMEWYGAFGLMVTLIWLYLELLRLLSKTRRRD